MRFTAFAHFFRSSKIFSFFSLSCPLLKKAKRRRRIDAAVLCLMDDSNFQRGGGGGQVGKDRPGLDGLEPPFTTISSPQPASSGLYDHHIHVYVRT